VVSFSSTRTPKFWCWDNYRSSENLETFFYTKFESWLKFETPNPTKIDELSAIWESQISLNCLSADISNSEYSITCVFVICEISNVFLIPANLVYCLRYIYIKVKNLRTKLIIKVIKKVTGILLKQQKNIKKI
jgi:hypothetical protein